MAICPTRRDRSRTIQTVTLSFFRFGPGLPRVWAFAMMGLARLSLRRVPDLRFWKLCGSGTGEGFTPRPNTAVYAILATWPDQATARARLNDAGIFRRYRARADEAWTVFLAPVSARGAWSGVAPFAPDGPVPDGPLAVLTRASLRPASGIALLAARARHQPGDRQRPQCRLQDRHRRGAAVASGHLLDLARPAEHGDFARADGPHARAIKAVREGDWFREELYARFRILGDAGSWHGAHPLQKLDLSA